MIWKVTWSQGKAIRCNHTLGLGVVYKTDYKRAVVERAEVRRLPSVTHAYSLPQACYSLPTNLWWSCAGQFSGSLKEPSYETTSWCESVLSWPEVLWALGQNVKIIGGWVDGDGDHRPATTWPPPKAVGKSLLLVNMYTTLSQRDLLLKYCQKSRNKSMWFG